PPKTNPTPSSATTIVVLPVQSGHRTSCPPLPAGQSCPRLWSGGSQPPRRERRSSSGHEDGNCGGGVGGRTGVCRVAPSGARPHLSGAGPGPRRPPVSACAGEVLG